MSERQDVDDHSQVIHPVIPIKTLEERHPDVGKVLLHQFGAPLIVRLRIDPVLLPADHKRRVVIANRISRHSPGRRWEEPREIGWDGLRSYEEDYCIRLQRVTNEHDLTERAAIGVMFLLIHELEGAVCKEVVQIGSGGDYLVYPPHTERAVQVEVSGIRVGDEAVATGRLKAKSEQVKRPGFVSVTTFQYGTRAQAHSYLHYLPRPSRRRKKPKGKRKGK